MKIVVVDIDGTVAKPGDRLKHIQGEKKDWDSFYKACFNDGVIKPIQELVAFLWRDYDIVFCTGRSDIVRPETETWLTLNGLGGNKVLMRSTGDNRHDTKVKPELLSSFLKSNHKTKDDVLLILEDRDSMVEKWRELGYTCLQVAKGDF